MSTKEKIKNEIDTLSDEFLDEVLQFLHKLKSTNKPKAKIRSLNLKGQFDHIDIRRNAYNSVN
jgi:hypothetical protein